MSLLEKINTNSKLLYYAAFLLIFFIGNSQVLKQKSRVIHSDAEGYFLYLPSWFVYGNYSDINVRSTKQFKRNPETNNYFIKYTCGVAILQAPFFFYKHINEAIIKGRPVNELGWAYNKAVRTAGWFYLCLGCFFLFGWLKRSFKWYIALSAVAIITLGTNLYFYGVKQPGAAHIYSFALFSIAINLVDNFYRNRNISWAHAIFLGLTLSLILLIRPTGIFLLVFLLLYSPSDKFHMKQRIALIQKNITKLLPFIISSTALWFFQYNEWYEMQGSASIYSYGNEGFKYLQKPKILRVLFDIQNGLFVYSPVMLIAVYGILRNLQSRSWNSRLQLFILFIITWVFASWWTWWFGGAYGHRCYVEYYSIFVLPLIWVVDSIYRSKDYVVTALFCAVVILMLHYSIGLTDLYSHPWEGSGWTWDSYSEKVRSLF